MGKVVFDDDGQTKVIHGTVVDANNFLEVTDNNGVTTYVNKKNVSFYRV